MVARQTMLSPVTGAAGCQSRQTPATCPHAPPGLHQRVLPRQRLREASVHLHRGAGANSPNWLISASTMAVSGCRHHGGTSMPPTRLSWSFCGSRSVTLSASNAPPRAGPGPAPRVQSTRPARRRKVSAVTSVPRLQTRHLQRPSTAAMCSRPRVWMTMGSISTFCAVAW